MAKLFFKASGRLVYLGSERDALTSGVRKNLRQWGDYIK